MLVLIVEDDPLVALDLEDIVIEHLRGAKVAIAGTIARATRLADQAVDFALFDVELKDGKTYELAAALQKRNIPFVFVSGTLRRDLPEGLRSVPFVGKPYSPLDVVRALQIATGGQVAAARSSWKSNLEYSPAVL